MFALSSFLLATSLVSATPVHQRRNAAVIPLAPRSAPAAGKVFDLEAVRRERLRVVSKYTNKDYIPGTDDVTRRRDLKSVSKPFDIRRRGDSGKEPLVDVFNQIDQSESLVCVPDKAIWH